MIHQDICLKSYRQKNFSVYILCIKKVHYAKYLHPCQNLVEKNLTLQRVFGNDFINFGRSAIAPSKDGAVADFETLLGYLPTFQANWYWPKSESSGQKTAVGAFLVSTSIIASSLKSDVLRTITLILAPSTNSLVRTLKLYYCLLEESRLPD